MQARGLHKDRDFPSESSHLFSSYARKKNRASEAGVIFFYNNHILEILLLFTPDFHTIHKNESFSLSTLPFDQIQLNRNVYYQEIHVPYLLEDVKRNRHAS